MPLPAQPYGYNLMIYLMSPRQVHESENPNNFSMYSGNPNENLHTSDDPESPPPLSHVNFTV